MKFILKDDAISQLIIEIQRLIKNTQWENCVFISGQTVINSILGLPYDSLFLTVNYPSGHSSFADFLARETGSFKYLQNPKVEFGYYTVYLGINEELSKIKVKINMTRDKHFEYCNLSRFAEEELTTIDALYASLNSLDILDPTKRGLDDLNQKLIHCSSINSLKNEPIQIMQLIQRAATFNFNFDQETFFAIVENVPKLEKCSIYEIKKAFTEILLAPYTKEGIEKLINTNVMTFLIPSLVELKKNAYYSYQKSINSLQYAGNDLSVKLACLFSNICMSNKAVCINNATESALMAESILRELRFDDSLIQCIMVAIDEQDALIEKNVTNQQILSLLKKYNDDELHTIITTIDCINKTSSFKFRQNQVNTIKLRINKLKSKNKQEETKTNVVKYKLPITGLDIMSRFHLKQTPLIGKLLLKVNNEFKINQNLTKEECLKIVEKELAI